MKLSLAWIFDHIAADWKKQDIENLISRFNQVVAEVESFKHLKTNFSQLTMGKVISHKENEVTVNLPEFKKEIILANRNKDITGLYFLIHKKDDVFRWAICNDVGLDKEGLLPAFDITDADAEKKWRQQWQAEDIILDIDNKSITHRPDMWGHRGFAREIAAYLELPFQEKEKFLTPINIDSYDKKSKQTSENLFSIEIKDEKACPRFSGLYIEKIKNKPCNITIASRLINIGLRPINALVDLTNYTMLDWSQPVHAYDATKVEKKQIIIRMAKNGEQVTLLDGQEIKLTENDLVVADAKNPMCLAGIMGGINDSVTNTTNSLFFESAHFSAISIRRTALRNKVRTDSSTRFEKTLDPNQITDAIMRFLSLCEQCNVTYKTHGNIIAVGQVAQKKILTITHSYLERRAGLTFSVDQVTLPLERLGFVVKTENKNKDITYTITVPTFRGTKDIEIAEDILEEIVRYYGFNKIPLNLPAFTKTANTNLDKRLLIRTIKNFLAHSALLTEQQNTIFYDEQFLKEIGLTLTAKTNVINPVSENQYRLVTSLMPNLFKNIIENYTYENTLRFFEYGRTWHTEKNEIEERHVIAGILFEKRKPIDFYDNKQHITDMLKLHGIQNTEWKQIVQQNKEFAWIMPYQSAHIIYNNIKVGIAGKVDPTFLSKLDALPESDAFFFEINASKLLSLKPVEKLYTPISKFPGTTFDLSMIIPLTLRTEKLQSILLNSNNLIERVKLIDFFEKDDWDSKRSVAFRIWMSNPEKTLDKDEIDVARNDTIEAIQKTGAQLRE